jgi:hypothetical protein
VPSAKSGFWFAALVRDQTLKDDPEAVYKQDTSGMPTMGKCHNTSKFGFIAFPDTMWKGKYTFVVNENNTIYRGALTGSIRTGSQVPPGLQSVPAEYLNWPTDEEAKRMYGGS